MGTKKYKKQMRQVNLKANPTEWRELGRRLRHRPEPSSLQEWFNHMIQTALRVERE